MFESLILSSGLSRHGFLHIFRSIGNNSLSKSECLKKSSSSLSVRYSFVLILLVLLMVFSPRLIFAQDTQTTVVDNSSANSDVQILNQETSADIRLTFSYGWSQRFSSTTKRASSQQRRFDEELQTGQAVRFTFHYFPQGNFGIGLKFNQFFTSHSDDFTLIDNSNGMEFTDRVSEEIRATFIGLSGMHREKLDAKFQMNFGIALGIIILQSDFEGFGNEINFSDNSLGGEGEVSLDYFIAQNFALGIGVAVNIGPVQEMVDQGITVNALDFNRIDVFGGIRFYF